MSTKNKSLLFVAVLLLCLIFAPASHAALSKDGPVDPANGFPAWYQDANGLSLAPCFDTNGFCPITMASGPGFDATLPIVFPTNFPEEGFYFNAETFAGDFLYIAALEFAFANTVRDGDQMVFARIRHRNKNAPAGTYTITHPYGVDTIEVTAADVAAGRGLFVTEDIGIAPQIFTGALAGRIGPFLTTAGGLVTSPDGNVYVGNGVSPVAVTGTAVTSVNIQGPVAGSSTSFAVEGKVIGMSVTPTSITFPAQRADVNSAPVTVTVTNLDGVNALTIASIVAGGTNAADFVVTDVNCLTGAVAAGGNCTFTVTFNGAASATAARTASITISGALATTPKVAVTPVTGIIDSVPPTVVSNFPNTDTAPANVNITFTFSEAMLVSSITNTTLTVLSGVTPITGGTVLYSDANKTASFTLAAGGEFTVGAVITAETSTFMTDLVGNPLSTAATFSFTATEPDRIPPTITSVSPANNDTGVQTGSKIILTFSESMLSTSITDATIQVTSGGVAVEGTITVVDNVATFTPAQPLKFGAAYTVTIASGALDLASNAVATGQTLNFVTNFEPEAPEVVSPANGSTGVTRPVVLRWKPSTDQDQDAIKYHLFLCNNQNFIGTAPQCLSNVDVTPTTAAAADIYYAGIGSWGALLSLLGLGFAFGFKGRRKIFMLVAVLVVSGLFLVSCGKKKKSTPTPPVSTDLTFQVSDLSPNVKYFWKIEADDGKGGVSATRVMEFTTQ